MTESENTAISTETDTKQIVYMVSQEGYTDDEIDLFQLLLPPIKYKLQILLVLILGIIVGIGVIWYSNHRGLESTIEGKIEDIKIEQKNTESNLRFGKEDLFNALANLPDSGTVYRIVGAEYQFIDKVNPNNVQTIKLDTFKDLNNSLKEELEKLEEEEEEETKQSSENYPVQEEPKPDFDIILNVEKVTFASIKQSLIQAYQAQFALNQETSKLEYQTQVDELHLFVLLDQKQKLKAGTAIPQADNIDSKITVHRANIQQNSVLLTRQLKEQKGLQSQIDEYHQILADNVRFQNGQNKIPWEVWKNVKAQTQNGEKDQQIKIIKIANQVNDLAADQYMFQLIGYIYENKLKVPLDAFEWPAFEYLTASKEKKRVLYTFSDVSTMKTIAICFSLALLLGIISVYIRTFITKVSENRALKEKFQSLTEAITYWKL